MDQARFTPIAEILVTAYLETGSYSKDFREQYGCPPTILAKAHHLRSVVQAEVAGVGGLRLGDRYVEFGRVEITELSTGECYVLQSESSLTIEMMVRQRDTLFDATSYIESTTKMLIYAFEPKGLELSLAGAIVRPSSQRLYAAGPPAFIGVWPYDTSHSEPFDQDESRDAFGDLGDVDMDEQGEDA